jgi:hypothetical protein
VAFLSGECSSASRRDNNIATLGLRRLLAQPTRPCGNLVATARLEQLPAFSVLLWAITNGEQRRANAVVCTDALRCQLERLIGDIDLNHFLQLRRHTAGNTD